MSSASEPCEGCIQLQYIFSGDPHASLHFAQDDGLDFDFLAFVLIAIGIWLLN